MSLLSLPLKHLVDHHSIRIVLGSASARRVEALTALLGSRDLFDVVVSSFEETLPHTDYVGGAEYCMATARGKAKNVMQKVREGTTTARETFIVTADTVVCIGKEILEKPIDGQDAERMLSKLSGKEHDVHTAVLVYELPAGKETFSFVTTTKVRFATLSEDEIRAYVATGEPLGRAGAYSIQNMGRVLIESITGDFFNVAGFPSREFATRFAARLGECLTR